MLFPIDQAPGDADRLAFQMCESGETVTFGQLEARANQVARVLRSCGVTRGRHVALLMKNHRRFLEACFAADRAGVYYTTISTRLTAEEIAYIVRDCAAQVLVVSADLGELIRQLRPLLPEDLRCFTVGTPVPGFESWEAAVDDAHDSPIADPAQGLDMLYSSGTTGRPKGVKWPLPPIPAGARTMLVDLLAPLFGYGRDCRYLSPAPLYHAAPLRHSMTVIKLGGTAFVMASFDAERSLQWIARHRITHSQWVPTMFVRMLKLPQEVRARYDLSSLQVAVHAAAPCPVEVKQGMLDWWGPIIHEYYAGTENNGFCSITPHEWLQHKGSVGRAAQGVLHICDESGQELPAGETGLVYFSDGPEFEYHNDPVRTAHSRNARGWSTLGDIGRLDDEGYLYLVDRKAFMIISGGVNIYPQEAESILVGHPSVADAAVIGVPSEDLGEEVKAVVQLLDPGEAGPDMEAELLAYCRQRLATFKCPRSVDFDAALPRQPTGKLYKQVVRARYWPA
ncbi:MAG: acyl-CoA synthetase [Rubrivivax sp.]|jgi:fatty-acyl-CoA synthase|nr:acyl-CoA synthetase [Betaproteobacteria bacterium]MBK8863117.1 acyl-CoA synthetase [Betaproteobacteria bacterium]MBP9907914.1 acyl-CoA synthetase [Rubrivivax sp.]